MSQITRPTKQGGATTYQGKVGAGYTTILASEMDADLDTIYSAWNTGVDGSNIRPGVITGGMLAPGAVGSRELADGGVATVDLADAAVTTPKLADGAVTAGKLAGRRRDGRRSSRASIPTRHSASFRSGVSESAVRGTGLAGCPGHDVQLLRMTRASPGRRRQAALVARAADGDRRHLDAVSGTARARRSYVGLLHRSTRQARCMPMLADGVGRARATCRRMRSMAPFTVSPCPASLSCGLAHRMARGLPT